MTQPLDYSFFDNLKSTLEMLSGGKNTVLFDDLGLPSVMVRIPRFNFADVGLAKPASTPAGEYGEALPAFRCSAAFGDSGLVTALYIAKYQASIHNNRACSLPYKDPATSINFDTAKTRCTAKGTGWHLMSNAEWAAVAEWSRQNNTMPHGNNNYLEDIASPHESAVPSNTGVAKGASGTARSLTGSGPDTWNHDHGPFGISDLNGNVWEWVDGLKITDGVAVIAPDLSGTYPGNDFALSESSWLDTATNITTGMVSGQKTLTLQTGDNFTGLGLPATVDGSGSATYGNDVFYFNASGERLPIRGGNWGNGAGAGVWALYLYYARSHAVSSVGFRPAFVA